MHWHATSAKVVHQSRLPRWRHIGRRVHVCDVARLGTARSADGVNAGQRLIAVLLLCSCCQLLSPVCGFQLVFCVVSHVRLTSLFSCSSVPSVLVCVVPSTLVSAAGALAVFRERSIGAACGGRGRRRRFQLVEGQRAGAAVVRDYSGLPGFSAASAGAARHRWCSPSQPVFPVRFHCTGGSCGLWASAERDVVSSARGWVCHDI